MLGIVASTSEAVQVMKDIRNEVCELRRQKKVKGDAKVEKAVEESERVVREWIKVKGGSECNKRVEEKEGRSVEEIISIVIKTLS